MVSHPEPYSLLHSAVDSLIFYSIEFDRDCDYFAIAGVTKKIKVSKYFILFFLILFSACVLL